jgi:sugar/nucleoside kinase (ribokinase family)
LYDAVVGVSINPEVVVEYEDLPVTKKPVTSLKMILSGSSYLVWKWLRLLGHKPLLVGAIGRDDFGRFVQETLKRESKWKPPDYLLFAFRQRTSLAIIALGKDGHEHFAFKPGYIEHPWIETVLKMLREKIGQKEPKLKIATGVTKDDALVVERLFFDGGDSITVLNPRPSLFEDRDTFERLLSKTTVLCLNREEAAMYLGVKPQKINSHSLDQFSLKGPKTVIVTLDSDGVLIKEGENHLAKGPAAKEVIDSTGAGDAFLSGFVAARYLSNRNLEQSLHLACMSASITCSKKGAWGDLTLGK